jgi:hypothetical protein
MQAADNTGLAVLFNALPYLFRVAYLDPDRGMPWPPQC